MSISNETQVNTYTVGNQTTPEITTLADGGWVIVWNSSGQDGDGGGIFMQAYDADGTPQGVETQVNTHTASNQDMHQITALADGGWVITWHSESHPGDSEYGVFSQAFNADGTTRGIETQVNTFTADNQTRPEITALTDGGWVGTWISVGQDGSSLGVYAQAYNVDGSTQGGETQVNTFTAGDQTRPEITALTDGGWVVTWVSDGQDGSSLGVYAQAYNADGSTQGGETQVNTFTARYQGSQQISALTDGGWVITWISDSQDGSIVGIYAQAYNADGTAQGVETQVNSFTLNSQTDPQIAALADGGWVITWWSRFQDGDRYGIYAQAYNADGTVKGVETQVNTFTAGEQFDQEVAALADGGWVVTWQSIGQDGDGYGIYAQAYNADGSPKGEELQVNTYTTGSQNSPQITALADGGWTITWISAGQDGDGTGIYSRTFQPVSADDITLTITGTQEVGETLTATLDGVNLADSSLDISYIWTVNGVNVAFTSDNTFLLSAEHAGKAISVSVVIDDTLFNISAFETSTPTGRIDDGNNDPTGAISLTSSNADPAVYATGDMISADVLSIDDLDGLGAFTYQWMRSGEAISGANADTYQVVAGDAGHRLTLVITYTDGAGFDELLTSPHARIEGFTGIDEFGSTGSDLQLGTDDRDKLNGWKGDDFLFGNGGHDILLGSKGNDLLSGGGGKDKLVGGSGDDRLLGGSNRDTFVFNDIAGNDTIADFEDGVDRIKIKAGAADFDALTLTQSDDDVVITYASTEITVLGITVADLTVDDFRF